MSINLHLSVGSYKRKGYLRFDLYQTPTNVTEDAERSGRPKDVYFAWLDLRVESTKPKIDPRLKGIALEGRQKAEDYQHYLWFAAEIESHKQRVETFLKDNPSAQWHGL